MLQQNAILRFEAVELKGLMAADQVRWWDAAVPCKSGHVSANDLIGSSNNSGA